MNAADQLIPKAVPDFRLSLISDWRPGGANHQLLHHVSPDPNRVAVEIQRHVNHLSESSLWFIGSDMADLAFTASASMPGECTLAPEMVPDLCGLATMECPVSIRVRERDVRLAALSWVVGPVKLDSGEVAQRLAAIPYVWHDNHPAEVGVPLALSAFYWSMASPLSEAHDDLSVVRVLASIFALAASPGICGDDYTPPTRHAAKRGARVGIAEDLAATRVIRLRRAPSEGEATDGGSGYHHRWIVSGHWRSQPYGPRRTLRKPVWIAPHVKGPDGAPMLSGEKVKALVR